MKKKLVTAELVRQEHAAGRLRIEAPLPQTIVTAEARGVAEQLGVAIVEQLQDLRACRAAGKAPECPAPATPSAANLASAAEIEAVRSAILEKLPPGCVSEEVVDQLIRKIVEERRGGHAAASPGTPSYAAQRIARGIKHVRADSVDFGVFAGAGAGNQVGLTDVVTSQDGSPMAAGYMSWSNCFFPWTLDYDEIDIVLEGELHIRSEGQTVAGRPGDVIYIPKGSAIEFGTPGHVRFLYVTYPANWQEGQG